MTKNNQIRVKQSFFQRYSVLPYAIWSSLFIIVPLIFVAYYAFTDYTGSFTFSNIAKFFTDYLPTFGRSMRLAFIATVICLLLGYPCAYAISKARPSTQKVLILLIMLPMWMNLLLRSYSLMTLIQDTGLINKVLSLVGIPPLRIIGTETAVVIGMVYDFLPYMILPIYSVMTKLDPKLIEAASDLGCNSFGVLCKVIFPLSLSGVISGITMVFVPCVSTFYISQKLGSGKVDLIGDVIERQSQAGNYNLVASLSFVLMIILIIGLLVVNKFTDNESGGGMMP